MTNPPADTPVNTPLRLEYKPVYLSPYISQMRDLRFLINESLKFKSEKLNRMDNQ